MGFLFEKEENVYKNTPSKQDYGTPPEFIKAIEKRFGKITFDLAAHSKNYKNDNYFSLEKEQDSIKLNWPNGLNWLNPPFSPRPESPYDLHNWTKKCKDEIVDNDVTTLLLTPAAVGTNWFRDNVIGFADVYFLNGRLKFLHEDGQEPTGVQIDMMVSHYHNAKSKKGIFVWDWREDFLYTTA